jgi:tetratricopeptide (TPR) repeat protein
MGDVLALQDKVRQKIVTALAVKLTAGEQKQVSRKEIDDVPAYDSLLKGWEHYRRFAPDDFAITRSYFEKAIELVPEYGRAYAALAQTYLRDSELGKFRALSVGASWFEGRLLARKYLQMAMKNPTSLAHQVASAMNLYRRQYEEAIAEGERAIALDPNDHRAHWIMAWVLIFAGSPGEGVDFAKTAMRLDPHYTAPNLFLLGLAHFAMGNWKRL